MKVFNDTTALAAATLTAGQMVETKGYYSAGDGGGARYLISTGVAGIGDITLANSNIAVLQYAGDINVKWLGVMPNGTDYSTRIQSIVDALPEKSTLYFPSGEYRLYMVITTDNITIKGDGYDSTILKLPDNAQHTIQVDAGGQPNETGVPCVIDFGQIGDGNFATAISGGGVIGLTVDGNKANTTAPLTDLFGWGVALTKASGMNIDVIATNTHAGGVGQFINSNKCFVKATVYNAGFNLNHPGYDMNSSQDNHVNVTCIDCNYGARLLDNCFNNVVKAVLKNPTVTGFIYNNQSVNSSSTNIIDVTVNGGCSASGVSIGDNCTNSHINATIVGVTGFGVQQPDTSTSVGLDIRVSTKDGQLTGCYIGGDLSKWTITSETDGLQGAQGSHFAITVDGDNNTIDARVIDSATWQVRGIQLTANSNNNNITSYDFVNTGQPFVDSGTGNTWLANSVNTWQDVTLINSWGNTYGSPYPVASYLVSGNKTVRLRGSIQSGTLSTVAFNLPVGARPSANIIFATADGQVQVDTNGDVTPLTGTSPFTLNTEFSTL